MAGGTQGATIDEVCRMAADWLQTEMEYRDMDGEDFPEATFGNEPKHGGQTLIVAINAGRDTVKKSYQPHFLDQTNFKSRSKWCEITRP